MLLFSRNLCWYFKESQHHSKKLSLWILFKIKRWNGSQPVQPSSSLYWIISLSNSSFSYNGVYYIVSELSICYFIDIQKGSNGDGKQHFSLQDFIEPKNGLLDPQNLDKESKQHRNGAIFELIYFQRIGNSFGGAEGVAHY